MQKGPFLLDERKTPVVFSKHTPYVIPDPKNPSMKPLPFTTTTRRLGRLFLKKPLEGFYLTDQGCAESEAMAGSDVRNLRVLYPPERIQFASPDTDPFVPVGKYYRDGCHERRSIFVCEVPEAKVYMPTGLVCTRHFKALTDAGLEHRLPTFGVFGKLKPRHPRKLRGTYSTINYCFANNFWHWMLDCVPKIHSLAKIAPSGVTLLMPPVTTEFQRETLRYLLPDNFLVRYDIDDEWVETELFLWPSLVSGRCMGLLPSEYYDAVRRPIFQQLGLPGTHAKTERIYVSRAKARKRRVLNEEAVTQLLERFGFRSVCLEDMTFRQTVELFHGAEIVIGPHGAGLGAMFFSGDIPVVVLYPTRVPPNYFHSLAIGLGQSHHYVSHDGGSEDDNFMADLAALERVLRNELNLQPLV
jgi:hypothetical protein